MMATVGTAPPSPSSSSVNKSEGKSGGQPPLPQGRSLQQSLRAQSLSQGFAGDCARLQPPSKQAGSTFPTPTVDCSTSAAPVRPPLAFVPLPTPEQVAMPLVQESHAELPVPAAARLRSRRLERAMQVSKIKGTRATGFGQLVASESTHESLPRNIFVGTVHCTTLNFTDKRPNRVG